MRKWEILQVYLISPCKVMAIPSMIIMATHNLEWAEIPTEPSSRLAVGWGENESVRGSQPTHTCTYVITTVLLNVTSQESRMWVGWCGILRESLMSIAKDGRIRYVKGTARYTLLNSCGFTHDVHQTSSKPIPTRRSVDHCWMQWYQPARQSPCALISAHGLYTLVLYSVPSLHTSETFPKING